jgi:hypothetical protein
MRPVRLAMALLLLAGCSGKPTEAPPKVTVEGKVVYGGSPVRYVMVTLHPVEVTDPNRYSGATEKDGTFKVECPKGRYKVTLAPLPVGGGGDAAGGALVAGEGGAKGLKAIPAPYRDKDQSPIQPIDVSDGGVTGLTLRIVE